MRERKRAKATRLAAGMFVRLPGETAHRVRLIAATEKRYASAMLRILIEEALATRADKNQAAA
jgi:hypothetical protein